MGGVRRLVLSAGVLTAAACGAGSDANNPYARKVAETIPKIEKSTNLEFKTPPRIESQPRDSVRAFLERRFHEELPESELSGMERSYKAFGLIPAGMDLRRFHYTDIYAGEARQAFPGFALPTNLDADNQGKPTYRLRPRYNSEYVWNLKGLSQITPIPGTAADYQTSPLWIIQP